jgi:molybdate transport system ATP-binding protein
MEIKLRKKLHAASGDLLLDVDIACVEGSIIALYGESGAGKTSILRMIAGLLRPDEGVLRVREQVWYDGHAKFFLPPQNRHVGFVFQDYALFPNMSVRENIAYGIGSADPGFVDDLIATVGLENLQSKRPDMLSGGQRQRVALARAMARRPSILLLDEPFAALDTSLRLRMHELVQQVHERFKVTTLLVSHDILDVARLADVVFVLQQGKIVRQGKPADVVPPQHIDSIVHTLTEKLNYKPR